MGGEHGTLLGEGCCQLWKSSAKLMAGNRLFLFPWGSVTLDVFVSYSSSDKTQSLQLVGELEKRGLKCWIAPRDIPPGSDYATEIMRGLKNCRALVVLVSKTSVDSQHVRAEVARASSDGKPIFPVRLVDIQVAGGLQFFLELSQWVDFFPSPTTESYDHLAQAIRTGKPARKGLVQHGINARRWAMGTIAAVVAVVIATLGGIFGLQYWQTHQVEAQMVEEMKRYEEEAARQQADAEKSQFDNIDVQPQFRVDEYGILLTGAYSSGVNLQSGQPRLSYSINDGEFRPLDQSSGSYTGIAMDVADTHKIVFRIDDPSGEVIKEVDKTAAWEVARKQAEQILSRQFSDFESNDVGCTVSGCSISYYETPFCNPLVKGVDLLQGDSSHTLDLGFCADIQTLGRNFCVEAKDLPARLDVGSETVFRHHLADGTSRDVAKPVTTGYYNPATPWMSVPPVAEQPTGGPAPVLLANYTPEDVTVAAMNLWFGYEECNQHGTLEFNEKSVLIDLDGKGLIQLTTQNQFAGYFYDVSMRGGQFQAPTSVITLSLAVDDASGTRNGPWSYHFDPADVVRKTAVGTSIPEIGCTGDTRISHIGRSMSQRERVCLPVQKQAFFDVAAVEFGPSPDSLRDRIDIDFTPADLLNAPCDVYKRQCPPFVYDIPEDWSDVYSRIILRDGTATTVKRHAGQR